MKTVKYQKRTHHVSPPNQRSQWHKIPYVTKDIDYQRIWVHGELSESDYWMIERDLERDDVSEENKAILRRILAERDNNA